MLHVPKTAALNEACETPIIECRQELYRPIEMLDLLRNIRKFSTHTQTEVDSNLKLERSAEDSLML